MKVEPCLKMFTIIIEVNTHQNAYYNLGIGALHVSSDLILKQYCKPGAIIVLFSFYRCGVQDRGKYSSKDIRHSSIQPIPLTTALQGLHMLKISSSLYKSLTDVSLKYI